MEFRVPIQMTELIIKAALPGHDSQWCIIHICYLAHRQFSWLGLCMYTPSQLHQPAILHFDECYICKQNKCLMIQQGQIILVLECKNWKIRFLCWDICLWMCCTVLIDCTKPVALACVHFNWYSHSPSFQASVDCIHYLHRNFRIDREFLVEVFYFFLAQVLPEFHQLSFNSGAVWIKYSLTSNCFDAYSHNHLLGISVSIWIFSGYEAVFNFSLVASCIHSNSATFYCDSLSSKTESEVFNTSLLILYASAMMLLYVSTTLPNFCLVLVAWLCCSTPCRFTEDMSTTSKLSNWFHFIRCIIQSILINVIHWSLLHLCVQGTCIDDVFITSYAFTAKHVTWLNTDIFCFKLLRHIKDNHFRSFGFSSMNLQYTTALGCMSLKDVTEYLSVVQTNSHIFTMMFQQTCSSQINSLGVFTVVSKCFNAQDLV